MLVHFQSFFDHFFTWSIFISTYWYPMTKKTGWSTQKSGKLVRITPSPLPCQFTSHLLVHHWYTSLLFDTAALWLLIKLYVYMNSQLLGPQGEPAGKLFCVTVPSYVRYACMKYDYYVVVSSFLPVIMMPQCQASPSKWLLLLDDHMNWYDSLSTWEITNICVWRIGCIVVPPMLLVMSC